MWQAYGISDQGCVRENNEDAFYVGENGLFILADGMGGAQAGERASRMAIDSLLESLTRVQDGAEDGLRPAFEEANRKVMAAAAADASLDGMGTTLIAAMARGTDLLVASVGDSRAYLFDSGKLLAITEDQTWVNEVGRRLGMNDESLRTHPMRHMLTMAIGLSNQLRVHLYSLRPRHGTQVLLCSDGLHGVVPEARIAAELGTGGDLETKCRALIEAAKRAGGPDNITIILLRWTEA